ncbi:MAG: ABC transporter permease subunit [Deltaproteobacteria bacterium]|nr:ABC transporter permease subunit [Deltaproteobacteria bacterium]
MNPILSMTRKESGELLKSGRGLAWLAALTAVLSVLSLLLVSNTELSLLDNAQVVYMVMGTICALGALLAVVAGSDSLAGERERGSLVPLLLTPLSPAEIVTGKMGGQVVAWCAAYVLGLPYLWAVGSRGQNLLPAVLALAAFGTPLVLGFGFFAVGLSARFGTVRTALSTSLVTLVLSASPVLLGPGLRQSAVGKMFDAANPFSAALNGFDGIVIDSQPFRAQAARFAVVLVWLCLAMAFAGRSARTMKI